MSSVDNRVVKMSLDNLDFETAARQTLDTLNKLESQSKFDKLKSHFSVFEKSAKSIKMNAAALEEVQQVADHMRLQSIAEDVNHISGRFNALGAVAFSVLNNITSKAMSAGASIARSLTIEPIIDGFHEYETTMNSIKTIQANLPNEGMESINATLGELNDYADQTVYSFGDMSRSIGLFTAAGVGLKPATTAIKGLANVAAGAGAGNEALARATYQVSQALQSGTIRLMDWNSLVNAGMANPELQEQLKSTARAHGVAVDSIIAKEGSFRDSLQQGWLTADIFVETMERAADANNEWGKRLTEAATKVTTFTQLVGTVKEAIGTGWATSMQIIIGNFEQARDLWTSLNDIISPIISNFADARNKMLQGWVDKGGRQAIVDGIKAIGTALHQLQTGELENASGVLCGIYAVLNLVGKAFSVVATIVGNVGRVFVSVFKLIGTFIFKLIEPFGDLLFCFDSAVGSTDGFRTAITNLFNPIVGAIDHITKMIASFDGFRKAAEKVSAVAGTVFSFIGKGLSALREALGHVMTAFLSFAGRTIETVISKLTAKFGSFQEVAEKVGAAAGKAFTAIGNGLSKVREVLSPVAAAFMDFAGKAIEAVITKAKELYQTLKDSGIWDALKAGLEAVLSKLQEIAKPLGDFFLSFQDGLPTIQDFGKAVLDTFGNIAKAIGDVFGNIRSVISGGIGNVDVSGFSGIGSALGSAGDGADKLASGLERVNGMFDNTAISGVAKLGGAYGLFSKRMVTSAEAAEMVDSGLADLAGTSADAAEATGQAQTPFQALQGALENISKATPYAVSGFAAIGGVLTGRLIWNLGSFVKSLKAIPETVKAIKGVLGNINNSLQEAMKNMKYQRIALAAGSLLMLAAAIKILADIPLEDVASRMAVLAAAVVGFVGVIKLMSKWGIALEMLDGTSGSMFRMALGLLALAAAFKILAGIRWEDIGKGAAVMAAFTGAMVLVNKFSKMDAGISLFSLGAGVLALAVAMRILAKLDGEALARSLGAVLGLLAGMTGAVTVMSRFGKELAKMAGGSAIMVAMAGSIVVLALALKLLSTVDPDRLLDCVIAISSLIAVMTFSIVSIEQFATGFADALQLLAAGAATIGIATAILILAAALKILAGIEYDKLQNGVKVIAEVAAILTIVGVVFAAVGKQFLAFGAGVALLGIGLILAAASLQLFAVGLSVIASTAPSAVDAIMPLLPSFAQIAGVSLLLLPAGAALLVFGAGAAVAGVGLILAAVGFSLFAGALQQMADLDIDTLSNGLLNMTDVIATLTLPLMGMIAALPGAFALLLTAAAFAVFGPALEQLASQSGSAETIKTIMESVADGMLIMNDSLFAAISFVIVAAGFQILGGALQSFADKQAASETMLTIFDAVAQGTQDLANNLGGGLTFILVANGLGILSTALTNFVDKAAAADTIGAVLGAVKEGIDGLTGSIAGGYTFDMVANGLNTLGPALENFANNASAGDMIKDIMSKINEGISTLSGNILGGNAFSSVTDGLTNLAPAVETYQNIGPGAGDAIRSICQAVGDGLNSFGLFTDDGGKLKTAADGLATLAPTLSQWEGLQGAGDAIGYVLPSIAGGLNSFGSQADYLETLSNATQALQELAPAIETFSGIDGSAAATALDTVSTALSSFNDTTTDSLAGIRTNAIIITGVIQFMVQQFPTAAGQIQEVSNSFSNFASSISSVSSIINSALMLMSVGIMNAMTSSVAAVQAGSVMIVGAFIALGAMIAAVGMMVAVQAGAAGRAISIMFASGILGGVGAAMAAGRLLGVAATTGLRSARSLAESAGRNFAYGFASGIQSGSFAASVAAAAMGHAAAEAARRALDIRSPSRVMRQVGLYFDQGMAQGIDRGTDGVVSSVNNMTDSVIAAVDPLENYIRGMDDEWTIRPVVDMTGIDAAIGALNDQSLDFDTRHIGKKLDPLKDVIDAINDYSNRPNETKYNISIDGATVNDDAHIQSSMQSFLTDLWHISRMNNGGAR